MRTAPTPPFDVAVIGGGPAGLMAAEVLAAGGARVTVYDRMPSLGRKLLLAGRGGLNLTHSEPFETLITRYGEAATWLRPALEAFPPAALQAWCEALGQSIFVGSSGRVFPRAMKASPLLRAWLRRLAAQGVAFALRHHWRGWEEDGALRLAAPQGEIAVRPRATILALGGASWPRLGSDGSWVDALSKDSVEPLRPANCGFAVAWSPLFAGRFEGQPLKRIALTFGDTRVRGEVMITRTGLEGGAIYALSGPLRETIIAECEAPLRIDLLPDRSLAEVEQRLAASRGKQSLANVLRKALHLSPVAIALLREPPVPLSMLSRAALAARIKALTLPLVGVAPLARAISTAGGVRRTALDELYMLRSRPGTFIAGEMLDWEAPTGGYLLQATLATGAAAGHGALDWLAQAKAR
ncbi:MAG: aminoacetone oxidase family FAD-binding enzyme [Proteobacteria bacterium]|nr:MAG: aminoacetone oxidase family FAD-binding enzyme [Pseudomonadota bacterium]